MAADHLLVSELFFSIQGESTFAGYPCVFIRLCGCNLRCNYCDAAYTYEEPGKEISFSDIVSFVENYPGAIVEITGGEPLLQKGSLTLMEKLLELDRVVLLETNGSLDIAYVPQKVVKIMDLKCPESGMDEKMELSNLKQLNQQDEVKCVLSSRKDYDWAVNTLNRYNLLTHITSPEIGNNQKPSILFSPVFGRLDGAQLAEWILQDNLPVKLQIQLHKYLWPEQNRGV